METPGWLLIGLSLCALCASMERLEDGNHSKLGKKSVKRPAAPGDHTPASQSQAVKPGVMDLRMPGAHPTRPDHYICTAFRVEPEEQYITNYESLATSGIAHHVLLFACDEPAENTKTWDCHRECKGQSKILYGWARNAPPTRLPKGVGYRIGGDTGVKYLVLQIHYKNPMSGLQGDYSGLRITVTKEKQKYIQGIFLLVSESGVIPPHKRKVNVDVSCQYNSGANIYPFGFRTHAHKWSRVVTGYQNNGSFHLIGRGNPQWPQAFYPTEDGVVIKPGDYLAARCSYNSINETRTIFMGMTHTDEMCNFYIMYYTDAQTGNPFNICSDDHMHQLSSHLPADSDVPPPHNFALEEQGEGHLTHQGKLDSPRPDLRTGYTGRRTGGVYAEPRSGYDRADLGFYRQRGYDNDPYFGSSRDETYNPYFEENSDYNEEIDPEKDYYFYQVQNQRSRNRHPDLRVDYPDRSVILDRLNEGRGNLHNRLPQNVDASRAPVRPMQQQQSHNTNMASSSASSHVSLASPQVKSRKPVAASSRPTTKVSSTMGLIAKWPQINPGDHVTLGSVAGVAVDSNNNVHIFHRGSHVWGAKTFDETNKFTEVKKGPIGVNPLVTFNKQGRVIQQWGKNMFYIPHGLYVDSEDNIWVTDCGLHQVMKFTPGSTKPALVLGKKLEPGSDDNHFCKPTDVAVLPTGEFFVADGYCNSRILKFSKEGKILKKWGTRSPTIGGDGMPPPSTFYIPHSLTLLNDKQILCVADRENGRIQCFDFNGKYVKQIHHTDFNGRLFALDYDQKHGVLFAVNGPDPYRRTSEVSGFTLDFDTGLIIDHWQPGTQKFQNPHDIAVSNSGEYIYVAEIKPHKIWKFHYTGSSLKSMGVHQSVKKAGLGPGQKLNGHPSAIDSGLGEVFDDKIEREEEKEGDEFNASIIVSCVLIVPVVVIIAVVVFLRVRRSGKFPFFTGYRKNKKGRFNLGQFFTSHTGFDRLSTEESDHELDHLNSDSETEEYSATSSHKA